MLKKVILTSVISTRTLVEKELSGRNMFPLKQLK